MSWVGLEDIYLSTSLTHVLLSIMESFILPILRRPYLWFSHLERIVSKVAMSHQHASSLTCSLWAREQFRHYVFPFFFFLVIEDIDVWSDNYFPRIFFPRFQDIVLLINFFLYLFFLCFNPFSCLVGFSLLNFGGILYSLTLCNYGVFSCSLLLFNDFYYPQSWFT